MSRPPDDSELVERARRGDEDAYEELVRAYQGIAFRTAYVIAGNASDELETALSRLGAEIDYPPTPDLAS